MVHKTGHPRQRGVALVVALLMMLIVTMLGTGLTVSSRSGTQVGTSFTAQQLAFQAAEAGLEHAREALRLQRWNAGLSQATFSNQLLTASGADGLLVSPNDLTNFGVTNGFLQDTGTLDDAPVQPPSALFGASYQVFLTNDPLDGATNLVDTNNTITLTAFGSGPNGVGFAAVQGVYETIFGNVPPPLSPAPVTLLGPNVNFFEPTSNQFDLNGDGGTNPNGNRICYPSIAVTSNSSRDVIRAKIDALSAQKQGNFRTCNPAGGSYAGSSTVINYIDNNGNTAINPYQPATARGAELPLAGQVAATPPELTVQYWQTLQAQLTTTAHYTSTSDPGFTLGRTNNPKVVVINGAFALNQADCPHNNPCAGVLFVAGDLTVNGTPSYTGAIYAVGTGNVVRNGNGNSIWCGGIIVANTVSPQNIGGVDYVGIPTYTQNGGGTSSHGFCDFAGNGGVGQFGTALRRLSFQQLRDS